MVPSFTGHLTNVYHAQRPEATYEKASPSFPGIHSQVGKTDIEGHTPTGP